MQQFGAHSMVQPLRQVVISRPNGAMTAADPALWHYAGPLDGARLHAQHAAFEALLRAAGVEVALLEDGVDGLADAVFTHDPSLVTHGGAILLRMGKALRAGEVAAHGRLYAQLGLPCLGAIEAPGSVEGGDCLWLDERTLLVGRGFRTNQAGIGQLQALLAPQGIAVLAFDLPYGAGPAACLHLGSVLSLVDHDLAVVHSPLLPVALWQLLAARGVRCLEVAGAEFARTAGLCVNVLALAPRRCVLIEEAPATRRALEAAGCEVRSYPGSELCIKAEGGPTCLTRPTWRG